MTSGWLPNAIEQDNVTAKKVITEKGTRVMEPPVIEQELVERN
jgi:hypothetical protein